MTTLLRSFCARWSYLLILMPATVFAVVTYPDNRRMPVAGNGQKEKKALQTSHADVHKVKNGLVIKLPGGRERRYRDALRVDQGTYAKYRYLGYLKRIGAHVIYVEKMNPEMVLLSSKTGKEAYIGRLYSLSPNGTKILSSDCVESLSCFYQLTEWPSGKRVFIQEQRRDTGVPSESDFRIETPIEWKTVSWKSDTEIAFAANGSSRHGLPQFQKVLLKYKEGKWHQSFFVIREGKAK